MKTKTTDTEKMIYEIFKLCDRTVWMEDWLEFQKTFEKILKKFGYDIYPIYYGKTKKEFMKAKKEVYNKWLEDKKEKEKRMKKPIVYIKNRPQK
jgi:5'-deoxynucleotidase YfbR-like HD superfamily hydrolase